jgi:tetratricopeptide (TPR) repeat protein
MADPPTEARIRDLKRRLDLEPGSRLFVALAEDYRKTGRLADALSTLQKGLLAHPHYLSAHVALGRAYLEAGQITEAIATFSKVLGTDPGNLVSAKSLADIYLSRGDSVEAIKKYKLYRALAGDRSVDPIIERLELELVPPPPPSAKGSLAPPPPPTFYDDRPVGPVRRTRDSKFEEPIRPQPTADLDVTSVKFELDESGASRRAGPEGEKFVLPLSRDVSLASLAHPSGLTQPLSSASAAEQEVTTRAIRADELPAVPGGASPSGGVSTRPDPAREDDAEEPQGRVLADLYFAQGHFTEALAIYDDLVAANPSDPDLLRLRRDAEARLLPAAATMASAGTPDRALERRLAKIRTLKHWLSVVQTA